MEEEKQTSTKRRAGRQKKSGSTLGDKSAPVVRRRGRSSKLVDEDTDYQPAEGDLYAFVL